VSWTTYGFDRARTGFNPRERVLGPANADRLHLAWRIALDGVTITSPVVAAAVGGRELVYVGTERGVVEAVDATSGRPVWVRRLGSVGTQCDDVPGDRFSVSGTPVIDAARRMLLVVGSNPRGVFLHALSLSDGLEAPGWPVRLSTDPVHMHVWGALTLSGRTVYAAFAGLCDIPPYYGKVVAVDASSGSIDHTWYAVRDGRYPSAGGGIWAYGGVAVDPADGSVFTATGNSLSVQGQALPDGESVVRLTSRLRETAADHPAVTGIDVDFGSTPMLYRAPGCPPQLTVLNKNGSMFVYERSRITNGFAQRLYLARNVADGLGMLIGVTAYLPQTRTVYVTNPGPDRPPFRHGLLAFRVGFDCRLHPEWQTALGPDGHTPVSSPTVANGVVYYGDGTDGRVFAVDARSGVELWEGRVSGAVYTAPIVVNGRLLVASWDGDDHGALSAYLP
jgi:outer membrane protein assembly factor BamB